MMLAIETGPIRFSLPSEVVLRQRPVNYTVGADERGGPSLNNNPMLQSLDQSE